MSKVKLSKSKIKKVLSFITTQISSPPTAVKDLYSLPSGIESRYANSDDRTAIIQELCDHIGFYLGILSRIEIKLVKVSKADFFIDSKGRAVGEHRCPFAGLYTTSFGGIKKICIANEQQYRFENVAAIIAHECTHNYISLHGISIGEMHPELFTDILAVYLGFGFLLLNGYESFGFSIGYITNKSIRNTILCAMKMRGWRLPDVTSRFESNWDKIKAFIYRIF